jgi:signal transduction histidine kinase/pSer/pThr/pTyr-binding forkhead associated (FHA) protein
VAKASLLVIHGPEQGARFELGDQPAVLGRGMHTQIRIPDTEVSRMHAVIQRTAGGFQIADRNSSNGTFVNGVAVTRKELLHGDQIQLGRTVLLFADDQAERSPLSNDLITILQQHDPSDRSSIVSQVSPDVEQHLATLKSPDVSSAVNFGVLYRIAEEAVRPSIPLGQLLQRMLDLTIEAVGAERGCILLIEPETKEWQLQAVSRRNADADAGGMPVSRSIVEYVLRGNQGVRTTDAQHDQRFDPEHSILQAGIREAMCVPLQGRHALDGVIYVDTTTRIDQAMASMPGSRFREDQLRLLVAIGRQAALAVENSRYQQAIVKAERLAAMGQTIATLSHHIKNILQGVRGGSYLIDLGLKDHNEEMVRKGWQIVEKNQGKIYHMVLDMLTFSKERQPAWQRASVNQTVSDVIELMQPRAEECGVALAFKPAAEMPESTFDPESIHRAVLNVVTNAIDAVEGRDEALVQVETGYVPETETIWISVADNGPGIPPEQMKKLFSLFESTKGARGTGLGLAVSQKILREHGGEIAADVLPEGGARFTLAWPHSDEDHQLGDRTMA